MPQPHPVNQRGQAISLKNRLSVSSSIEACSAPTTLILSENFLTTGLCGVAVNRSCHGVLPKSIVLNPNSTYVTSGSLPVTPDNMRIILLTGQ
ncbi:hypothetical protein MLD38_038200 [Melastoma candidum]|uniref:Uncharacterized protein n=1 Tax=Melastoma candidum TaxID=119954 RepID=A0ACB9L0G3_9MYRT|nr:hypothetical protein MLD38_038200 [Melastoma candidum]